MCPWLANFYRTLPLFGNANGDRGEGRNVVPVDVFGPRCRIFFVQLLMHYSVPCTILLLALANNHIRLFVRVCVYECVSAIALMPPQCMCSISSRTGNRPPHQGQTVDGGPRSALSKCLQEGHPWTNELAIARPMNMHARVLYSHCCIKLTEFGDSDSRTFLAKKKPLLCTGPNSLFLHTKTHILIKKNMPRVWQSLLYFILILFWYRFCYLFRTFRC